MKKIICLLNGLTDLPLQDLNGVTPLQKANCQTLDFLASKGSCLAVKPPGFGGMETALLNLFGVSEGLEEVSQGALEAYSLGYVLTPYQQAFSVRFASIGEGVVVDVSDSLLSGHEGKLLCSDLNASLGSEGCYFLHLGASRAVLLSEHPCLNRALDKVYRNPLSVVGKRWESFFPGEKLDKDLLALMEKIFSLLAQHEVNEIKGDLEESLVNGLLIYNGGAKPMLSPFTPSMDPSRVLLQTMLSSSMGVARLLGVETLQLSPEKKKYEHLIYLLAKLDDIFKQKDVLVIDIAHLWHSTYMGELLDKVKGIEWLDRYFLKHLADYCVDNLCQLIVLPTKNTEIRSGEFLPGDVPCVEFSWKSNSRESHVFDEYLVGKVKERLSLSELLLRV